MNNSPVTVWRSHKKLHTYLNKVGRLVVWTKILVAPAGFEHQVPYLVGIVDFGTERLPLQIVDCEEKGLKINQKVVMVIRKIGKVKPDEVIEYGLKVKPL
ncbi:OB-fold domain-containing protein [Candidatus Daviesbacteria bacterium]|nr:OB-fold domain-containing protein [Candidatus Daviesbacteria bacterium]